MPGSKALRYADFDHLHCCANHKPDANVDSVLPEESANLKVVGQLSLL